MEAINKITVSVCRNLEVNILLSVELIVSNDIYIFIYVVCFSFFLIRVTNVTEVVGQKIRC